MADDALNDWEAIEEAPISDDETCADFTSVDPDFRPLDERIESGLAEKVAGNQMFAAGEYEAAWKQYDKAFVHIYTSKEEWEAIGVDGRLRVNLFKLPCHLNRGLCRLRTGDLENASWDFGEALRIDPANVKGLFRKARVLAEIVKREMGKEGSGELWDLDKADEMAAEARKNLVAAVKLMPSDVSIREALEELKGVRAQLVEHRKKYRADQKKLYSTFVANLDRDNQKLKEAEDQGLFKDMPKLERVRIA